MCLLPCLHAMYFELEILYHLFSIFWKLNCYKTDRQAVPSGKTQNVCTRWYDRKGGLSPAESTVRFQHQPQLLYVCTHIHSYLEVITDSCRLKNNSLFWTQRSRKGGETLHSHTQWETKDRNVLTFSVLTKITV